jgi:transposase
VQANDWDRASTVRLGQATTQKRLKDEVASVSAERTAHAGAIQNRDTIIDDLRLQLHVHNKHRFGSKSESSEQLALELIFKELEIEQAAETDDEDVMEELEYVPDITS